MFFPTRASPVVLCAASFALDPHRIPAFDLFNVWISRALPSFNSDNCDCDCDWSGDAHSEHGR
jgi:hypothetical protein